MFGLMYGLVICDASLLVELVMLSLVLTSVLSCLNSGLYTASRMLFVLAARHEAPGRMLSINRRGVPAWAILASSVIGFLCVIAAYVSPDQVFLFLLNSSGAIILFVYLMICLSQLRMRRMIERTAPEGVAREVLVLDNASADGSAPACKASATDCSTSQSKSTQT
jgi:L-asparagine transporter-like permease